MNRKRRHVAPFPGFWPQKHSTAAAPVTAQKKKSPPYSKGMKIIFWFMRVGIAFALVTGGLGVIAKATGMENPGVNLQTYIDAFTTNKTASSNAEPTAFDSDGINQAVAVLTMPDEGRGGGTYRWTKNTVTFQLAGTWPEPYEAIIRDAFAWTANATGLDVKEVTGQADITVVNKAGTGAYVYGRPNGWELADVTVELGCCRERAAREDIAQAFGPLGDRADSRSVFSQDHSRTHPSDFDAWILQSLYQLPAGSNPAAVRAHLVKTLPSEVTAA